MAIKTFKYFDAGVGFKDQAADNITSEGVIYRNGTSLKLYIQAAVRNIVTDTQSQTLTNKTISGASNTITSIPATALTAIIDTDLTSVSALDDTIPSAKATKAYVDAQILTKDAASEIAFTPAGTIAATNVQAAVEEVSGDIETHKGLATGAHAASAIANTPAGGIAAITVQAAINELDTEKANLASPTFTGTVSGISASMVGAPAGSGTSTGSNTGDQTATTVANTPSGNLAAVTVQAALNELQSDIDTRQVALANHVLTNAYHLEIQAATDAATTGSNASLAAFTGGAIRLTNASLISLSNIPAGANGQQVVIFNRTGASVSIVDSSAANGTAANRIYTGTSANIAFAKDAALILSYDSTSTRWQVIGGTGGGSSELPLGVLAQQTFESAVLTDFTQTGLTLVTASNLLIKNTKAAQLISNASVTQSFKQVIPVDNQFRGKNLTVDLYTRSSATQGNVTVLFYNETSSVNLVASQPITLGSITISATTAIGTTLSALSVADVNKLKVGQTITGSGIVAGTTIATINTTALTATLSQAATAAATVTLRISDLPQRQSFSFDVPTNCASLSYTISALAESGSPESYFDDIAIKLSATALSSTSISIPTAVLNTFAADIASGGTVTSTSTNFIQSVTNPATGNYVITYVSGTFSVAPAVVFSLASNVTTAVITAQSASSVSISVYDTVPRGAQVNSPFNITVTKQGVDFINPLTATTSTTIPLTTAQLVQTPDSYLKMDGVLGLGSTNTTVIRMDSSKIRANVGSDIQYNSSATLGDSFTALTAGTYTFNYNFYGQLSTSMHIAFTVNGTQLSTSPTAISNKAEVLDISVQDQTTAQRATGKLSWTGQLNANDVVRVQQSNVSSADLTLATFSCSKQSSLKQLNPSSDAKITIPTHSLRFEGASTRGSTDTAIVRFDSQTITQGDGFSVVNTAANGTVVTMLKAGKLSIASTLQMTAAPTRLHISKNQTTLTSTPIASEVIAVSQPYTATAIVSVSGSTDVIVGDKIRICSTSAIGSDSANVLSLSLTENSIPANFSNVLPQWSQSDSCIQLRTANGYGSTNTKIRRFSNTVQNLGADVSYTDDAALGGSFLINTDGTYNISYTDLFSGSSEFGVTKNTTQPTANIYQLTNPAEVLTINTVSVNWASSCSTQVYLSKGDVLRAHSDGVTTGTDGTAESKFTISKVGKPNLTSVDVTPFVNMKTTDTQSSFLSSTTGFTANITGSLSSNTNNGIYSYNSSTGVYTLLKSATVVMNASLNGTAAVFTQIFKNTTMISAAYSVNSAGYYANNSVAFQGNTGDTFYVTIASGTTTSNLVSVLATADNNATASPTQQVSSDTMSFAFKATAIDPAVDAIGTFNTYTYGAANSTAIATSAPTQTSSSMNINGIFVTARAYGGTLGSTTPARFDIFIGKGLKSKQVDAYINAAKSGSMSVDHLTTATLETGSFIQYNETTGILVIDAGWCVLGGVSRTIGSDVLTQALVPSGYFVFNASKSPSLVTVPNLQQRIAYLSDVKASGTASGSAGAATTQTRTLNTIVDSTGIVTSLASNQFTLSKGVYNIEASAPAFATNNNRTRIRNITDSTTALLGTSEYATSSSTSGSRSFVTGEISITSAKVFELQHYTVTAAASNGLGVQTGSGESEVYATVKITKIKDI